MNGCKYKDVCKCDACGYVYFKECRKFMLAHVAWLTRAIRPFIKTTLELHVMEVWSKDMNKAKSAATQYALKLNSEVLRFDLNDMITTVMREEDLEGKVFYVEIPRKGQWKAEDQTMKCLSTFISRVRVVGGCVAVYVSPATGYRVAKEDAEEIR